MNITFLIGNGFDINLGLETRYSDFLKEYKTIKDGDNEYIKKFKKDILRDEGFWSDAEKAFGEYTVEYEDASIYSECHIDFCEKLADYLKKQEERLNFQALGQKIISSFSNAIAKYCDSFRPEQKDQITNSFNGVGGGIIYNFINFNYTNTLDNCIPLAKSSSIGKRGINNNFFENSIGEVLHVHGTTEKDMVLGVNDESQIKNMELFKDQPSEYLDEIIKINTNKMNEEFTDENVNNLLATSDLIYIYGMSIGKTDALWWKRIIKLMAQKPYLQVIIYKFDAPKDGLIRTRFVSYERKMREEFVGFSGLKDENMIQIIPRIHIDRSNIFENMHNLVNDKANVIKKEPAELVTT